MISNHPNKFTDKYFLFFKKKKNLQIGLEKIKKALAVSNANETRPSLLVKVIADHDRIVWWQFFSHIIIVLVLLRIQNAGVLFQCSTSSWSIAVRRRCLPPSAAPTEEGSWLRGDGAVQRALQLSLERKEKKTRALTNVVAGAEAGTPSLLKCY